MKQLIKTLITVVFIITMVMPSVQATEYSYADGLAYWWNFDETTGNVFDEPIHGNDIWSQNDHHATGKYGNGVTTSSTGYLRLNYSIEINKTYTINYWMDWSAWDKATGKFIPGDDNDSYVQLFMYAGGLTDMVHNRGGSAHYPVDDQNIDADWHMVTVRCLENLQCDTYIDAVIGNAGAGGLPDVNFETISYIINAAANALNSNIDDVTIWNRTLNTTEMTALLADAGTYDFYRTVLPDPPAENSTNFSVSYISPTPTNGVKLNRETITVKVSGNHDLKNATLIISGSELPMVISEITMAYKTLAISKGSHSFYVKAYDTNNTLFTTVTRTVTRVSQSEAVDPYQTVSPTTPASSSNSGGPIIAGGGKWKDEYSYAFAMSGGLIGLSIFRTARKKRQE